MVWFHKILNDLEEAINRGDRKRALEIVERELKEIRELGTNFFHIQENERAFFYNINNIKAMLSAQPVDKDDVLAHKQTPEGRPKEDFTAAIEMARRDLKKLRKHTELALDEELKLEQ